MILSIPSLHVVCASCRAIARRHYARWAGGRARHRAGYDQGCAQGRPASYTALRCGCGPQPYHGRFSKAPEQRSARYVISTTAVLLPETRHARAGQCLGQFASISAVSTRVGVSHGFFMRTVPQTAVPSFRFFFSVMHFPCSLLNLPALIYNVPAWCWTSSSPRRTSHSPCRPPPLSSTISLLNFRFFP